MNRHPQTITTPEQFRATEFADGVVYDDGLGERCRWEYSHGEWRRCLTTEYPDGPRTTTGNISVFLPLTLVSEPEPATPEVTDEQRAAWLRLKRGETLALDGYTPLDDAALIAPLLPSDLTDPQPVLPTEPGAYLSPTNVTIVLTEDGDWMHGYIPVAEVTVRAMLPLTRLVPEHEPITREQALRAVTNVTHGIQYSTTRDTTPEQEGLLADAILALVNGTDQ